jgi:Ni,Fe-hydrogenase III large subunit
VQRKWAIPDKEAYAIFYSLKKWDHLLRDVKFTLQTDHENLTYINFEGTPKVRRWKLLIQEYDFILEFIKGEDNIVADFPLCNKSFNCSYSGVDL